MHNIVVQSINDQITLTPFQESIILECVGKGATLAEAYLGKQDVTIDIAPINNNKTPLLPIHAQADSKNHIYIGICIPYAHFDNPAWHAELKRTTQHELHHTQRYPKDKFTLSLSEALCLEGLAQAFEVEAGHTPANYALHMTKDQLLDVSHQARAIIDNPYSWGDYGKWFHGNPKGDNKEPPLPKWAGYELGFTIISTWLMKNNMTASTAANVSHKEILCDWINQDETYFDEWLATERPALLAQRPNGFISFPEIKPAP